MRRARKLTPPKPAAENESVRDHSSLADSLKNILSDTLARIEVVAEVVNNANAELSDLYIVKEGVERALNVPSAAIPATSGATFKGISSRR